MKTNKHLKPQWRVCWEELKKEAVRMLLDVHAAPCVAHQTAGQHSFG
jgi:hypothetical protein